MKKLVQVNNGSFGALPAAWINETTSDNKLLY